MKINSVSFVIKCGDILILPLIILVEVREVFYIPSGEQICSQKVTIRVTRNVLISTIGVKGLVFAGYFVGLAGEEGA